MIDEKRLRLHLRLHLADGVGAVLFRRLMERFGSLEAMFDASAMDWRQVEGVGEKTASAISAVSDADVDEELSLIDKMGASVVCCDDAEYPAALKTIYDYPAMLYVRGRLQKADAIALGVVGARHCTHYGMEQAQRFGELLGRCGFTVVSGGARGIDASAHRGALAVGARTVAVMGCGLSRTYPPENKSLFEQIVADGGALVSELTMKTAVLAGNFPTRNRIISGMSLGVLIVEAARHSGSLITAREAAEQGRAIFALPGRVDSVSSQGANELIRTGATLVQNLEDILEQLGEVGAKMAMPDGDGAAAVDLQLDATEGQLAAALDGGPLSLDELSRRTGLPSARVAATMTMLVLKGAVAQQPGNVFARKKR